MRPVLLATLVQLVLVPVAFAVEGRFDEPPVHPAAPVGSDPVKVRFITTGFCSPPSFTVERGGNVIKVRFDADVVHCETNPIEHRVDVPLGTLSPGTYDLQLYAVDNFSTPDPLVDVATFSVGATPSACSGSLCLLGGRFIVTAEWTAADGSHGSGFPLPITYQTGALWFFDDDNLELTVKLIDACSYNDRFWVFASGLTDVGVVLRVRDRLTGAERTYTHPQGSPFAPITDTQAFACP
ncbi:MAG TPA: hypothetical protein VN811_02745 [Thermoanaerobaculia bacterium]|nr:hypothetical protein [Thermoanaerobaculia bacterium]